MSLSRHRGGCSPRSIRNNQRGVALIVSLVLLVVATLIGLAGIRGTTLQERMSANMYDRSLAFQRAEAALRAAEAAITEEWKIEDLEGQDCRPSLTTLCGALPDDDAVWVEVADTHNVNNDRTPGRPEYFIQYMGTGTEDNKYGLGDNADAGMYGSPPGKITVAFYRVTARSSAPDDAGDRSYVVLQSTVKRAI
jgi:type IV pilus assembly protein PilX